MKKRFIGVIADKGGVGKSLVAANLWEWIQAKGSENWTLAEVESRLDFSLPRYFPDQEILKIGLAIYDEQNKRTDTSLVPFERVFGPVKAGKNILTDFGASTFSQFAVWLSEHRGAAPFLRNGYEFTFLVMVMGSDPECADFWNTNIEYLSQIAPNRVIMVRNHRDGKSFNMASAGNYPVIDLIEAYPPLRDDFHKGDYKRTLKSIAADPQASYRSQVDAEDMLSHFTAQLEKYSTILTS